MSAQVFGLRFRLYISGFRGLVYPARHLQTGQTWDLIRGNLAGNDQAAYNTIRKSQKLRHLNRQVVRVANGGESMSNIDDQNIRVSPKP